MVYSPQAVHTHRGAETAVLALIDRLEAAEAGSWELDADVHLALFPDVAAVAIERRGGFWRELLSENKEHGGCVKRIMCADGHYTTSIDAAVALAERCGLNVSQVLNDALESSDGIWGRGWDSKSPLGPQIARHICLAILREIA